MALASARECREGVGPAELVPKAAGPWGFRRVLPGRRVASEEDWPFAWQFWGKFLVFSGGWSALTLPPMSVLSRVFLCAVGAGGFIFASFQAFLDGEQKKSLECRHLGEPSFLSFLSSGISDGGRGRRLAPECYQASPEELCPLR